MRRSAITRLAVTATLLVLPFATSCILTSGQFLVTVDLGDLTVLSPIQIARTDIDLNDIGAYNDHKDDLEDLADLALLGTITNDGTTTVNIEFWMTPTASSHVTEAAVRADPTALPIWGALTLAPSESKRVSWDESAGLFGGRAALLSQVKGDGEFTLYILGSGALTYAFHIDDGVLVLVIDAGV